MDPYEFPTAKQYALHGSVLKQKNPTEQYKKPMETVNALIYLDFSRAGDRFGLIYTS